MFKAVLLLSSVVLVLSAPAEKRGACIVMCSLENGLYQDLNLRLCPDDRECRQTGCGTMCYLKQDVAKTNKWIHKRHSYKCLLLSLATFARGTCVHDKNEMCHNFPKNNCTTNQWMQINCCEYCGLHQGTIHPIVNGHWGAWSRWHSCSATCGTGTQRRVRHCNNPPPSHGGATCQGISTETQRCHHAHCPVNGGWGSWTSWYPCSVTCGNGIHRRERHCDRPSPSHGGSGCHGNATEIQTCNPARCHEGLTCLSCQGVLFPHTCDTVEHCGTHSICSTERYFDGSGNTLYNLGCKDAAFCHSRSIGFPPDIGNITIDNSFRSTIPYCRECCDSFMCNVKGCGNSGYADDRGPLCFSCTQQQTLDSCNTIKLCGRDEECSIEGNNFGPVDYFTSSCKNCKQHRSYSTKRLDYYRRAAHVCERCCSSDLCNRRTC